MHDPRSSLLSIITGADNEQFTWQRHGCNSAGQNDKVYVQEDGTVRSILFIIITRIINVAELKHRIGTLSNMKN